MESSLRAKIADDGAAAPQRSLVEQAMQAIKSHIHDHRLVAGDAIPSEGTFAQTLAVSRPVIREAFRSLSALKLIDVGDGRRARVCDIDASVLGLMLDHAVHTDQINILQIYDVRRTIEIRTVALAAVRRTAREAEEITAHAAAMRSNFLDPPTVMTHDIALHEAIGLASRNPLFSLIVTSFSVVTRQTWSISWLSRPTDAVRMESVEFHEAIAQAIVARDPRAAIDAMAGHFDKSVQALVNAGVS
jgi:GntR family transcriptional regulator, transcriptional repressor for pyruvate dehydrogenase complex